MPATAVLSGPAAGRRRGRVRGRAAAPRQSGAGAASPRNCCRPGRQLPPAGRSCRRCRPCRRRCRATGEKRHRGPAPALWTGQYRQVRLWCLPACPELCAIAYRRPSRGQSWRPRTRRRAFLYPSQYGQSNPDFDSGLRQFLSARHKKPPNGIRG